MSATFNTQDLSCNVGGTPWKGTRPQDDKSGSHDAPRVLPGAFPVRGTTAELQSPGHFSQNGSSSAIEASVARNVPGSPTTSITTATTEDSDSPTTLTNVASVEGASSPSANVAAAAEMLAMPELAYAAEVVPEEGFGTDAQIEERIHSEVRRIIAETTVPAQHVSTVGQPQESAPTKLQVQSGNSDGLEKQALVPWWRKRTVIISTLLLLVVIIVAVTVPVVVSSSSSSNSKESLPTPPQWQQLGQDLDGRNDLNFFGASLAMSNDGTILAAGAPGNGDAARDAGHVRVFELLQGKWKQLGQDLRGSFPFDFFGWSVALSAAGNVLAVGADQDQSGPGRVQVFEYDSDAVQWLEKGNQIVGDANKDNLGYAVSLSDNGHILVIGSPYHDGLGLGSDSGLVRVFQFDETIADWTQMGSDILGTFTGDRFGFSVSLSSYGNILAVGANETDPSAGKVRVFEFDTDKSDWLQMGQDIIGISPGDRFGFDVSISNDGTIVAASAARGDASAVQLRTGYVQVHQYEPSSNRWTQMGQGLFGVNAFDEFGYSVSISGDGLYLASGAPFNSNNVGLSSGHARIFKFNAQQWVQVGQAIEGEEDLDSSGFAVSLSDDAKTVAIGAYANDGEEDDADAGHVRVYQLNE